MVSFELELHKRKQDVRSPALIYLPLWRFCVRQPAIHDCVSYLVIGPMVFAYHVYLFRCTLRSTDYILSHEARLFGQECVEVVPNACELLLPLF